MSKFPATMMLKWNNPTRHVRLTCFIFQYSSHPSQLLLHRITEKKKANVPERVSFNSEEEKSTVVSAMEDELKTFQVIFSLCFSHSNTISIVCIANQTEKARAFALLKSVLADEQRRRAAERAREAEEQLQQLQQQQLAAQQQAQQQALTQPAGTQPTQSKLDDKSKTVAVNMSTTGGLMHRALSAPDR
jgi:biopolymer transport protein ExbB/TolQ